MKNYKEFNESKKLKTPNKNDIKIGDKFIINYGDEYIFKRYVTDKNDTNNQILNDGTNLENMLSRQFSYYNPKIGDIIEIVDLEKILTPCHSEPKYFTIKIGNNYYSAGWRSLKDMIK